MDRIRVWASTYNPVTTVYGNPDVYVDVYYSGGWNNIYSGTITNGTWVTIEIGSNQSVSSARIGWNTLVKNQRCQCYEFDFGVWISDNNPPTLSGFNIDTVGATGGEDWDQDDNDVQIDATISDPNDDKVWLLMNYSSVSQAACGTPSNTSRMGSHWFTSANYSTAASNYDYNWNIDSSGWSDTNVSYNKKPLPERARRSNRTGRDQSGYH